MILGFTIPYQKYIGTIEYSDEDQCYYGKLLNTTDLVNYEANDVKKLIEEFQKSVDLYVQGKHNCMMLKTQFDSFIKHYKNIEPEVVLNELQMLGIELIEE